MGVTDKRQIHFRGFARSKAMSRANPEPSTAARHHQSLGNGGAPVAQRGERSIPCSSRIRAADRHSGHEGLSRVLAAHPGNCCIWEQLMLWIK